MISDFLFLLGERKKFFFIMVPVFLLSSLLDVIGIGVLAPYIGLLVGGTDLNSFPVITSAFEYFEISSQGKEMQSILGLIILGIFFIKVIASLMLNKKIIDFSFMVATDLRLELFQQYQSLPYVEFYKDNQSKYIHNIFSVVQSFSQSAVLPVLKLIGEAIILLTILCLLWVVNSLVLYILLLVFIVSAYLFQIFVGRKSGVLGRKTNIFSKKIMQSVKESVTGFRFIRVMKADSFFFEKLKKYSEKYAEANSSYYFLSTIPRYAVELIFVSCIVIMSYFSISDDNLSATLLVFATAAIRVQPSISTIIHSYNSILNSKNSIDILCQDLRLRNDLTGNNGLYENKSNHFIELLDVCYQYPGSNNQALSHINLTIDSGDVVGLIGESGSGKSTLMYLLIGLLKPTSGVIYNGGLHVKDTMYVPQEVFLIDDTLANNIAIGCQTVDNDKILSSLEFASLGELSQQINQNIGDGGELLSGGQKQRVGLARMFYFDKEFIVLDEPTSALDSETEGAIIDGLRVLKSQGKTIVIISHNKAPLGICNKVFSLKDGLIRRV